MCYFLMFVILPLLTPADGGALWRSESLNKTTHVMSKIVRRETRTLPPPFLHLPMFVDSGLPLLGKEHFSPARGTGKEPLPETVRELLIPVQQHSTSLPNVSGVSVRTSCKQNKMRVQVQRSLLGTGEPQSQLKLGTCQASRSTRDYIYFEYDFGMCGTRRTVSFNKHLKIYSIDLFEILLKHS